MLIVFWPKVTALPLFGWSHTSARYPEHDIVDDMDLEHLSLWQISQVLGLICFEKTPVNSLFSHGITIPADLQIGKQLSFLDF